MVSGLAGLLACGSNAPCAFPTLGSVAMLGARRLQLRGQRRTCTGFPLRPRDQPRNQGAGKMRAWRASVNSPQACRLTRPPGPATTKAGLVPRSRGDEKGMRCAERQTRSCPRNCERRATVENATGVSPGRPTRARTRKPGDLPPLGPCPIEPDAGVRVWPSGAWPPGAITPSSFRVSRPGEPDRSGRKRR